MNNYITKHLPHLLREAADWGSMLQLFLHSLDIAVLKQSTRSPILAGHFDVAELSRTNNNSCHISHFASEKPFKFVHISANQHTIRPDHACSR